MKNLLSSLKDLCFGMIGFLCLIVFTILCFMPIFVMGLLKLLPNHAWRILCTKGIDQMAVAWTGLNAWYVRRFCPLQWTVTGDLTPWDPKQWYLVIANHQSWLDIVILQHYFHQKIPVLKFFIKDQMKWVPLFNFAWWAMGCPFMKRYSKAYIEKNPHKKGEDLKATQKALTLFKSYPSSIISFVEGTRYTREKHRDQQSPYQHLLKPKAGGIGQVMSAMGKQLQPIIDVTILYPRAGHSIWNLLCRRIHSVNLHIRTLPAPEGEEISNVTLDEVQETYRSWLNAHWAEKDAWIEAAR